jgi:hypothetical protein
MNKIELDKAFGSIFSNASWVASAVSKDTTRVPLTHLLHDDGWLVASDGCRLHATFFPEFERPAWENGLYRLCVNKKSELLAVKDPTLALDKFPDWLRLFPEHRAFKQLSVTLPRKQAPDVAFAEVIRFMPKGQALNYEYFSGLGDCHYTVYSYPESRALFFANDNRIAVIMPMRA